MDYEIKGEIAQVARMHMSEGESLWASKGSLMAYTRQVDWSLKIPGGVAGAMRRSMAGEGLSLTFVESRADDETIVLAANAPGHIAVWDLADGPVVTTRGAFLAAWGAEIDITVTIARRAGAALFGGAGVFLQRVSGKGQVLVHGAGDFETRDLAAGEEILVSTGNLAAFSDSVDYDIRGVGGCGKMLFGREGIFMTRLAGPGRCLLQTLKREE